MRLLILNISLWIAVVLCAMGVVTSTYTVRVYTHELESLRHQAADLHVESGQLLLEESSLASYIRIEKLANEKLHMLVPDVQQVVIIKP